MLVSHSSCYFSSLEGNIAEVLNIIFWKLVPAGFHAILTCRPVYTSFQVDIKIYEDKLSQSGDRILSSHITKLHVAWAVGFPPIQYYKLKIDFIET